MAETNREEGNLNSDEEKYDPYAPPEKLTPNGKEYDPYAPPEEEKTKERSASEKESMLASVREEMYKDKELGIISKDDELDIEDKAWNKIEKAKKEMKEADLSHREKLVLDIEEKEREIKQQRIDEKLAAEKLKEELEKEKIEQLERKIGNI